MKKSLFSRLVLTITLPALAVCSLLASGCGSIRRIDIDARTDAAAGPTDRADTGSTSDVRPSDGTPTVDGQVDRAADASLDRPADAPSDRGAVDRPPDGPADAPADMAVDQPPADAPRDGLCICSLIYAPVCGVDGRTYNNSCEANCAGVAIAHTGSCTPDGGMPSCTIDSDCVLYPVYVGGCCGSCRARGEPRPPEVACLIPCQTPYTGCLCVNNQCTPQGGGMTDMSALTAAPPPARRLSE